MPVGNIWAAAEDVRLRGAVKISGQGCFISRVMWPNSFPLQVYSCLSSGIEFSRPLSHAPGF